MSVFTEFLKGLKPEVTPIKRDCQNCQFSEDIDNIFLLLCRRFPNTERKNRIDFCYEHQFDYKKHLAQKEQVKK